MYLPEQRVPAIKNDCLLSPSEVGREPPNKIRRKRRITNFLELHVMFDHIEGLGKVNCRQDRPLWWLHFVEAVSDGDSNREERQCRRAKYIVASILNG